MKSDHENPNLEGGFEWLKTTSPNHFTAKVRKKVANNSKKQIDIKNKAINELNSLFREMQKYSKKFEKFVVLLEIQWKAFNTW